MMTSAQVVETSVNVTSNSPSQDNTHLDDHNLPNYDMTPGFKPFTVVQINVEKITLISYDNARTKKCQGDTTNNISIRNTPN